MYKFFHLQTVFYMSPRDTIQIISRLIFFKILFYFFFYRKYLMILRCIINSPIRLNVLHWDQLHAVAIANDLIIFVNTHLLAA